MKKMTPFRALVDRGPALFFAGAAVAAIALDFAIL
jgi:hypothetical protein